VLCILVSFGTAFSLPEARPTGREDKTLGVTA
jgi:hypothetical protein